MSFYGKQKDVKHLERASAQRIVYWDNLKAILIFLVVLGHFLLPVATKNGRVVEAVFRWIYLFHMPAFVFVSGFFAKSYVKRGGSDTNKLIGFLFMYALFVLALGILKSIFSNSLSFPNPFSTTSAQWYLLCMFFWYLVIPHVARIHPAVSLAITIITALLIGAFIPDGSFLSLSRFFVFLPFFIAGYHVSGEWIKRIRPWMTVLSVVILIAAFLVCLVGMEMLKPYYPLANASGSYASLSLSNATGIAARLVWYAVSSVLTCAVLCVVPKRHTIFTYIGERTLAVYILHRLIRELFVRVGAYDYLGSGITFLLVCLVVSAVVTFVCSGRRTSALLNKAFSIPWIRGHADRK